MLAHCRGGGAEPVKMRATANAGAMAHSPLTCYFLSGFCFFCWSCSTVFAIQSTLQTDTPTFYSRVCACACVFVRACTRVKWVVFFNLTNLYQCHNIINFRFLSDIRWSPVICAAQKSNSTEALIQPSTHLLSILSVSFLKASTFVSQTWPLNGLHCALGDRLLEQIPDSLVFSALSNLSTMGAVSWLSVTGHASLWMLENKNNKKNSLKPPTPRPPPLPPHRLLWLLLIFFYSTDD